MADALVNPGRLGVDGTPDAPEVRLRRGSETLCAFDREDLADLHAAVLAAMTAEQRDAALAAALAALPPLCRDEVCRQANLRAEYPPVADAFQALAAAGGPDVWGPDPVAEIARFRREI